MSGRMLGEIFYGRFCVQYNLLKRQTFVLNYVPFVAVGVRVIAWWITTAT